MHNALTGHSNAKAPPRAVLAGSHLNAEGCGGNLRHVSRPGVLGQCESRPARTQGHSSLNENAWRSPDPLDESEHGQDCCLS